MSAFSPEVSKRINEIAKKHGGKITAEMVVDDAKNKKSPLHRLFQWDLSKAAMEHWLDRASVIIRSIKIEVVTTTKRVNITAYVRDPQKPPTSPGYVSIEIISKSPEDAASVMAYEIRAAESAVRRCVHIGEALGLDGEARKALAGIVELREKINKQRSVRNLHATINA